MDLIFEVGFFAVVIIICLVTLLIADMFNVNDNIICRILSRMVYGYCFAIAICFVGIYYGMCI